MCVSCILKWFYFFAKEGLKYFFSLTLIYKDNLYESRYKAFGAYR